ncbi:MAG TPA: GMC family oxidoreductase [Gemmatimonadales bacterium]
MRAIETDVLVIGTGFGAAAPALRLAKAGLRVRMLERGPRIDPNRDFRQTQDPEYLLKYLKGVSGDGLSLTYAEALGGGSGFYEMVSLRAPSLAFEQVDQNGARLWPAGVDRSAMDPFYDIAEQMLRVEQIAVDEVPRSGLVFATMMKNLGYSCDRARYAVRNCVGSGYCVTGCIYGAKQTLLMNYLPQAVSAGAQIETDVDAQLIRPIDDRSYRAADGPIHTLPLRYEVLAVHRSTGQRRRYRARVVILGAGTVGSARLLMGSHRQLPDLSDQLGRNVAFNGGVKAAALLSDELPDGDLFTGRSHPGMISYEFLRSHGLTIATAKPLPLQLVASARIRLDGDPRHPSYWGEANLELMRRCRRRLMVLVAFGMTPPIGTLRLRNDGDVVPHLDVTDDLRTYYDETTALLNSIFDRNRCRLIKADFLRGDGQPHGDLHFSTAHQVGSCRMANTRASGVVDATGEVFGYPGLFVSDGAIIPSSLAVNTSLTILANAERVAAEMVRRFRPVRHIAARG